MSRKLMAASAVAIMAASSATGFIAGREGKENHAYVDSAGVTTICYGHTATAKLGQHLSDQQCLDLLTKDLRWTFDAVNRNVKVKITIGQYVALSSFVFNFGETAFRKSTLLRKLNAGKTKQACDEFMRWINAGGKPLHGLVLRRADERALCLEGVGNG